MRLKGLCESLKPGDDSRATGATAGFLVLPSFSPSSFFNLEIIPMPRTYEELLGEFDYERNVFGKDDDRKVVAVLIDKTVVTGKAREDELESGLTYLFRGYWAEHPRYGKQFQFHSFGVAQPVGQRGTVSYLTRGPGIGRKRAQQIWEIYGQDALEAIRERPKEVAAKVKRLTEEQAREAATYFQTHKDREIVTRDLEELLAGGGFPKKLIEKLIEKWGAKAVELIRENPFRLMVFKNVGFGKADKLYLQLGGNPTTPERLGWCVHNALHKDREGHTWRPFEFGTQSIKQAVAGADTQPTFGIFTFGILWAKTYGHIHARIDEKGREWIAEGDRAATEAKLANQVHRALIEGGNEQCV